MKSRSDAESAQRALHHQYVAGRYIEVFVYGEKAGDDKDTLGSVARTGPRTDTLGLGGPPVPPDVQGPWSPGLAGLSWANQPVTPPWAGLVSGPAGATSPSAGALGGLPGALLPPGSPTRPGDGTAEDQNYSALFNFLYEPPPQMGGIGAPPAPFEAMPAAATPGGEVGGAAAPPAVPPDTSTRSSLQV